MDAERKDPRDGGTSRFLAGMDAERKDPRDTGAGDVRWRMDTERKHLAEPGNDRLPSHRMKVRRPR